jgi:hypothetical protein
VALTPPGDDRRKIAGRSSREVQVMRERVWFWLLWASNQVGTQVGRVMGFARAGRSYSLAAVLARRAPQSGPSRSVFIVPQGRPHERNGLAPRRTATRHPPG